MSESEPRRSVRATKGQHTKAFDDQPLEAPKMRGRKKKQQQELEPEEEIIRCVCGATDQDDDEDDQVWVACDTCGAWQHNVCMGMPDDNLPEHYYCEQCRPQLEYHKELLSGIAEGRKPWEERQKAYRDRKSAEAAEKKKKPGKKKGVRGSKRVSDSKEDLSQAASSQAGDSPAPEAAPKPKGKKEGSKPGPAKRKADESDKDVKTPAPKVRKVSETEPKRVEYVAPADLPAKMADVADTNHRSVAQALQKAVAIGLGTALKNKLITVPKDTTPAALSELWAIQIERAVRDSHPDASQYSNRCRTLVSNLKANPELSMGLLHSTLSPPMLAVMTSDQLATKEQQRLNAELRAKSEKQSILVTDDGPRMRRTHKGDEMVENDAESQMEEARPAFRRPSARDHQAEATENEPPRPENSVELPAHAALHVVTQGPQQSPRQADFDINKVFSSVKSPTGQERRPSGQVYHGNGPGVDADVDRLLQDETDSPPYSPTDESEPDVVWRGSLAMNTIADFPATAKFVAGANLAASIGLPWSTLIPKRMAVAGRIDEQKAIEYLCGLRYSDKTDVVVVSLSPSSESSRPEFRKLFDYFSSKKRYAVIGQKAVGNVRDTYLVPVPAGDSGLPEFLLNFSDNLIPQRRGEPILLAVFVYRNLDQHRAQSPQTNTTTPTPAGQGNRQPSVSGPAFSPAVGQSPFAHASPSPVTSNGHPTQGAHQVVPPNQAPHGYAQREPSEDDMNRLRQQGEAIAREVLGPFIDCATVQFLLPQAIRMTRREWQVCRGIFERDERARVDLKYLSQLLQIESEAMASASGGGARTANTQPAATPST
ncbi:SPOC domain-containing protein [Verticillium dahliae]